MDCKDFQNNLFAREEGKITPDTRLAMERHFMECESCARLQDGFRAFERAVEAEKALGPPPFVATRIIQRLENAQDNRRHLPKLVLRPAVITFLLLAALVTGYLVGNHGMSRKSQVISGPDQIEILRSELYVVDFVEEDNTLLTNY
jgi:hypothetical protein